jgi:hypothetical protein
VKSSAAPQLAIKNNSSHHNVNSNNLFKRPEPSNSNTNLRSETEKQSSTSQLLQANLEDAKDQPHWNGEDSIDSTEHKYFYDDFVQDNKNTQHNY